MNNPTVNWALAESLACFASIEAGLIRAQQQPSIEAATAALVTELGANLGASAALALVAPSAALIAQRAAEATALAARQAASAAVEAAVASAVLALAGLTQSQRQALVALVGGEQITATIGSYGATVEAGVLREGQSVAAVLSAWTYGSGDGGNDKAVDAWVPARLVTAADVHAAVRAA
jgi:hypothetical protein